MTQRILKTSVNNQEAIVLMGWDRKLQYHFMVIDLIESEDEDESLDEPLYSNLNDDNDLIDSEDEDESLDEPLYSNLNDDKAGIDIQDKLSYFVEKARSFGVEIPKEMIARLQTDKLLNLGNDSSIFNEDGVETKDN